MNSLFVGYSSVLEVTPVEFLRLINWGSSKLSVRSVFSKCGQLPAHPSLNAIGFVSQYHGTPITIVCYFRRAFFSDKLCRVNVGFFEERPNDVEAEMLLSSLPKFVLQLSDKSVE